MLSLERRLRQEEGQGSFIDDNVNSITSRAKLGEGTQFTVYSAQANFKKPIRQLKANEPGQFVAVKVVKPMVDEDENKITLQDWSSILLEVRALMHEHIRYHPNIVRLLGFTWAMGWSSLSGSVYPMLIMEYAQFGTLKDVQALSAPLSFAVKQKLCHDIARGLSILHACGIIHGDLKHENVLIFDNPYEEPPGQPYLAKLADFGGAAMVGEHASLKIGGTFPYKAPETSTELSPEDLKKTDVYSFGLLFWRALLDGKDLLEELSLATHAAEAAILLRDLKNDDKKMLDRAFESIAAYFPPGASVEMLHLISFTLRRTLRTDPTARSLAAAQAALRNGHIEGIAKHLAEMQNRNSSEVFGFQDNIQRLTFGADKIGFLLGKMGDFYDAQQNLPGYRSKLAHPVAGKFLFEPMKVKSLLSWEQQVKIVEELKAAARADGEIPLLGIPPFKAAFYVFQSYLAEFGVVFDAKEVCYWLSMAAEPDDKWEDEVFAQAWLWRVCEALQCPQSVSRDKSIQYLKTSVVCGFKGCASDWKIYIETLTDASERQKQMRMLKKHQSLLRTYAGGVGMWHYFPSTIRKQYDLADLSVLERQIREELGEHYERYLLITDQYKFEEPDKVENRFAKLYVSGAGHALLHYAATFGKVDVLKYLLDTYTCDIDRGSTLRHDSPLVCAVRSAQYDCAIFLLSRGAQPGRISSGEEGPLHWLCGFESEQEEKIATLAKRLIDTGADIEELSSITGSRGITADWDSLLDISTTPLGRAVIARKHGAIKVLLDLGANPGGKGRQHSKRAMSPVEISAMLFYPEVLQTLLERMDKKLKASVFDEARVLELAHERKKESVDPSCLQSRLVRLGSHYKSAILDTFHVIRKWNDAHLLQVDPGHPSNAFNDLLYKEVHIGDADIVEALLELGHDPNGTERFRPLQAAASMKNEQIFKLLIRFGADVLQKYLHTPDVKMTFLHAISFATRGARTPNGVKIAEQLLAAGVPVEVTIDQCPVTPFALCVMNHCFDVADILLAHGADLNPVYARPSDQGPLTTLIGGLVIQPNEMALESIRYLKRRGLQQPIEKSSSGSTGHRISQSEGESRLEQQIETLQLTPAKLSIIGVPSRKMSVLHQVAHWTHDTVANNWPVSFDIMELLLSAFDDADVVNELCPEVGTPLSIAVRYLNVDFVRLLLQKKADPSIGLDLVSVERIAKSIGVPRKPIGGTPLDLSLLTYEGILLKLEGINHDSITNVAPIERLFSTAGEIIQLLLLLDRDEGMLQLWTALQARKDQLLATMKHATSSGKHIARNINEKPVDLSVLTEERPSGWSEGCEVTDEMALRILLRQCRTGFEWPDP